MYLSEKEKERRYGLVRQAMVEQDFDVLLVVGNGHATGNPRFSTGSFRYLTDFFIFSLYGVLLFFREEDPVMLVPMELQETMAKKYSWVRDVRIGLDYGKIVAEILETKKLHSGKVGIVSMDSLPASTYLSLCERLPGADFADAASLVLPLMFVKGEEERALMQRAAEINDEIVDAYIGLAIAQKMADNVSDALVTLSLAAAIQPNSSLLLAETATLQFKVSFGESFESGGDDESNELIDTAGTYAAVGKEPQTSSITIGAQAAVIIGAVFVLLVALVIYKRKN